MNPFEVVYGENPPLVLSYLLGVFKLQEVEKPFKLRLKFYALSKIIFYSS
jgi:hypothetical protein